MEVRSSNRAGKLCSFWYYLESMSTSGLMVIWIFGKCLLDKNESSWETRTWQEKGRFVSSFFFGRHRSHRDPRVSI
ncbi:unnamed protein product [Musa hybrid cultivar]